MDDTESEWHAYLGDVVERKTNQFRPKKKEQRKKKARITYEGWGGRKRYVREKRAFFIDTSRNSYHGISWGERLLSQENGLSPPH